MPVERMADADALLPMIDVSSTRRGHTMISDTAPNKPRYIGHWTSQRLRSGRGFGIALVLGLALVVASCGQSASHSTGSTATATSAPCRTWQIVPSQNPSSATSGQARQNWLFAVTALSPSDAWAVGVSMEDDHASQNLIERWNGAAWTATPSPWAGVFWAVTALSANDAWAVGGTMQGSIFDVLPAHTQIAHWDGSQWKIVASPDAGAKSNSLQGVAAISASDAWAVGGYSGSDDIDHQLIERWNGSHWAVVAGAATSGATHTGLKAVARIPGTNQLWAVGSSSTVHFASPAESRTLIERWDGAAWHLVPSPTLPQGGLGGTLRDVVALSATDAWAVGEYATETNQPSHPLIEHWSGTAWQVVTSSGDAGTLAGIAASAPADVRAVGNSVSPTVASGALIEQWNGTAWQAITGPNPNPSKTGESYLNGITADSAGNYWAVGASRNAPGQESVFRTLVERNCP